MKSVLISGATSMLGLALIRECINQKIDVVAVIKPASRKRFRLPVSSHVTVVECDINNLQKITDMDLPSIDTWYHFAWESTEKSTRDSIVAQQRNLNNTLAAIRVAHQLRCDRFIGAGSQAEYGRVNNIISEDCACSPETAYGVAKYASCKLGALLTEQLIMGFIWVRIFSVYGINDMPTTMIMYCMDELLHGRPPALTKCEQHWDYLYSADAAKAFLLLGKSTVAQGVYNLGSGTAKPLKQYVEQIRDAIDPTLPLDLGVKPYSPLQVMCLQSDISKLQRDTGFSPTTSFSEGIKELIKWFREVNIR